MWFTSDPQSEEPWDFEDSDDEDNHATQPSLLGARQAGGPRHHPSDFQSAPSRHAPCCPHCNSHRITSSHLGRRVGGAIGTIAGAATATARVSGGAKLGAEIGALLGTPAGPAGFTVGTVAGAVLGAMAGAAAGCAVGATLGEAIDAKILHNHRCIDCGRGFSLQTA